MAALTFKNAKPEKLLLSAFCILLAGASFIRIRNSFLDSDDWFILATGRYIVENGIPYENPFVLHEGFSVVIQQWLYNVALYGAYLIGSYQAMFVFCLLAYAVFCILFFRLAGFWTKDLSKRSVVFFSGALIALLFWTNRPSSVTLCVLSAELYALEKWRKEPSFRKLIPIVALSVFEANVHAAFYPFLFIMTLPYAMPERIPNKMLLLLRNVKWKIFLIWPLMLAAGLLNPYGIRGAGYLFLSYGSANEGSIYELSSADIASVYGAVFIAGVIIFATYFYQNLLTRKENFGRGSLILSPFAGMDGLRLSMAAGTLILAAPHIRNIWFLIFGILPLLPGILPEISFKKKDLFELAAAGAVASCIWILQASAVSFYITESALSPVSAADYLDETSGEVVLYTDFNNGAYFEWRGYEVYMDARPELFQHGINGKEDVFTEYLEVTGGGADCEAFLNKYGFTHLAVMDGDALDVYLKYSSEYKLIIDGDGYNLYEKEGF